MDPARMFTESLTPSPELENSQGQKRTSHPTSPMSAKRRKSDIAIKRADVRFSPIPGIETEA